MILKFRVETDGQDSLGKRNRVGVHQITSRKRADPAHGFNEPGPQSSQIARRRARQSRGSDRRNGDGCRLMSAGGFWR